MADSIKKQIVARLLAVMEPLKANDPPIRGISRRRGFGPAQDALPSIELIIGEETRVSDETRGGELQFPIFIKINVGGGRDTYDQADTLAAVVQTEVEGDDQLSGLCNNLTYHGETPFSN